MDSLKLTDKITVQLSLKKGSLSVTVHPLQKKKRSRNWINLEPVTHTYPAIWQSLLQFVCATDLLMRMRLPTNVNAEMMLCKKKQCGCQAGDCSGSQYGVLNFMHLAVANHIFEVFCLKQWWEKCFLSSRPWFHSQCWLFAWKILTASSLSAGLMTDSDYKRFEHIVQTYSNSLNIFDTISMICCHVMAFLLIWLMYENAQSACRFRLPVA